MKHFKKTFTRRSVRLDGNQYSECTFDHCVLEIGCAAPFSLEASCVSINCEYTFVGIAANVTQMLAQLYADEYSRPLVEALFEQIKRGGLPARKTVTFNRGGTFEA